MKIKNKLRYLLNYRIIAKSKYFNADWYLKQNPDVKNAGVDPVRHYLQTGWQEGRNPSKWFNGNEYLYAYQDVKKANINPLVHYEKIGRKEKRNTGIDVDYFNYTFIRDSKFFNRKWYLRQYRDVAEAGVDLVWHYRVQGWKEGKNPSKKFNTNGYLFAHQDVKKANMNPLLHYEKYGKKEGIAISPKTLSVYNLIAKSKYFNKRWYLHQYRDVAKAGVDPVWHYLREGWKEGKNPSKKFNTNEYLEVNQDVKYANINPLLHYEKYGRNEGREIKSKNNLLQKMMHLACSQKFLNKNAIIMGDFFFSESSYPIDNFSFFEYLINKKDSKFIPYYILNKNVLNYKEIANKYKKHIIVFKDKNILFKLKIIVLCIKARYVLDSFDNIPEIFGKTIKHSRFTDILFTQHGITFFKQTFINPHRYGANNLNKIVVSNDYEYEIFKNRGGFNDEDIIKLGLFRWDKIKNQASKNEKYIFIYFTYRHYLRNDINLLNSTYFKNLFSLIKNKDLLYCLKQNNVKIKMAPHHALLPCLNLDEINNIDLISEDEIGEMKNKASMLITDYSSMCFEFMHQNKPVVFYRLDEKEFWESKNDSEFAQNINELTPLIFNVFNTEKEVVNKIINYINNNFKLEKEFKQKSDKFFYNRKNIREQFYNYLLENMKK